MEKFGKFMTIVLAIFFTPIINGIVFTKLWLWFIVPIFHLPELGVVQAIGIMLLIAFLRGVKYKEAKDDDFFRNFIVSLLSSMLFAALGLFLGWIISMFL